MKNKVLFIFVLMLAIISIQIAVLADMDAPYVEPYTVSISNLDGAEYYLYDFETETYTKEGTLNYGDEVDIVYEETIDGEMYGNFYSNQENQTNMYLLKASDFEIVEGASVIPENLNACKKIDAVVLKEDGITVHNGPAYGYPKEGTTIQKGTKITLYADNEAIASPWYYVKAEEYSGWVCALNGSVGFEDFLYELEKDYEMVTYKKLNVYKDTTYQEIIGTIPANTKIEEFLDIDDWSFGMYIVYNDISGYIDYESIATNMPWIKDKVLKYTVEYPAKMYKEGDLRSEVLIEEIPEGTVIEYSMAANTKFSSWIYATYNGVSGWVYDIEMDFLDEGETYQTYLDSVLASYEEESTTKEIHEETHKDEKNTIQTEQEENNITNKKTISGMQILMICIGLAIVISLTAFVTVLLVNKKNNQDKE